MKHTEVVKAVMIGGKLYTNPIHAAKRWVEVAGGDIAALANRRRGDAAGPHRAWHWCRNNCWIVAGSQQRYWRRVLPIFEKVLK